MIFVGFVIQISSIHHVRSNLSLNILLITVRIHQIDTHNSKTSRKPEYNQFDSLIRLGYHVIIHI